MSIAATKLPWRAELALEFALRGARTRLTAQRHCGPLLVQRPFHPESGGVCHAYLIHPPAGVVGGDELHVTVTLAAGAQVLLTTLSATRFYRSSALVSRLTQRFAVQDDACLEWLPQENLLFETARAAISTRIDLAPRARFVGWELLCLGRPACGEGFTQGSVDQRIALYRDGSPVLLERLRPTAGRALDADGAGQRGHAASATLIATGADAAHLDVARACLAATPSTLAGATLLEDMLVCRLLAAHVAPLRALCERLWSALRPTLLAREAHAPRIWST